MESAESEKLDESVQAKVEEAKGAEEISKGLDSLPEHVHTEEEMHEELKIPKDRVAVLIGSSGVTKTLIEKKTECSINVDSADGQVTISGYDAIRLFDCKDIVLAIGRGFNPKIALKLLGENHSLEVIRLRDVVGGNQRGQERLKSRIIGREGKVRGEIERLTKCDLSIYGKTVAILGDSMDVALCHRAVEMLLKGAMHKTVYRFLEKQIKDAEMGLKDFKEM